MRLWLRLRLFGSSTRGVISLEPLLLDVVARPSSAVGGAGAVLAC